MLEEKIIYLGNDLKRHVTILEVVDGIFHDITLSDMFEWFEPTEEMIAENVYDKYMYLSCVMMEYLKDDKEYKQFATLVVVDKYVDETKVYKFDCQKMEDWEYLGVLQGYGIKR